MQPLRPERLCTRAGGGGGVGGNRGSGRAHAVALALARRRGGRRHRYTIPLKKYAAILDRTMSPSPADANFSHRFCLCKRLTSWVESCQVEAQQQEVTREAEDDARKAEVVCLKCST
jgi:hypothetical protein